MKYFTFKFVVAFCSGVLAVSPVNKQCPITNTCFSINVPDSSTSSSGNDVYLQITGPTSYSWLGIGTGSMMSGSNMFIIYASGNGNNITLSGRKGNGHAAPSYTQDIKASLLDGSGVANGIMTANIRCSSCGNSQSQWIYGAYQGKQLNSDSPTTSIQKHTNLYGTFSFDLSQAKGGGSTNPFSSDSANVAVSNPSDNVSSGCGGVPPQQDSSQGPKSTPATVNPSNNVPSSPNSPNTVPGSGVDFANHGGPPNSHPGGPPFGGPPGSPPFGQPPWAGRHPPVPGQPPFIHVGPPGERSFFAWHGPRDPPPGLIQGSQSKAAQDNACQRGQTGVNGGDPSRSDRNTLPNNSGRFMFLKYSKLQSKVVAHAVLASLAFLGFFPLGAISIRLLSFPGIVWFHAFCQIFGQVLFTIAFALGVDLAQEFYYMNSYHAVIGILLFIFLWLQPIFGLLHHFAFKKQQIRTTSSYIHLWVGRISITLGIINGGLGFLLSRNLGPGPKVYGVFAAIIWLLYIMAIIVGERKRARIAASRRQTTASKSGEAPMREHYSNS